jgi:hypothetical protein
MDELPAEGPQEQIITMMSADTKKFLRAGGNTDDNADINTIVLTPSLDSGDMRAQKLYVDTMFQADTTVPITYVALFNNSQELSISMPVNIVQPLTGVQQYLQTVVLQENLDLYRNISGKFAWKGGPDGGRLIAWESSGYLQPYLCTSIVTQRIPFSFPGWKHLRRLFPAYISGTQLIFTVQCQDGRQYGPYFLPPTIGYRIMPQMLDRNIKDLAFSISITSSVIGGQFAIFQQDFTCEVKEWTESTYIKLAIFRA